MTFKGAKLEYFSVKSVAIPATDLPINSALVFERVWKGEGHDRNGSDTLVLLGGIPLWVMYKIKFW